MNIIEFFTTENKPQIEYSDRLKALTSNDGELISSHIRKVNERENKNEFKRRIDYTHFDNESVYKPVYDHIYQTREKISSVNIVEEDEDFANIIKKNYFQGKGLVNYIYEEILSKKLVCPGSFIYVAYNKEKKSFENIVFSEKEVKFVKTDRFNNVIEIGISTNEYYFIYKEGKFFHFKPVPKEGIVQEISNDTLIESLVHENIYEIKGQAYRFEIEEFSVNPFIATNEFLKDGIYKSFIDPIVPYLYRYAEITSENALTTLRHIFPKASAIRPTCTAPGCEDGYVGSNAEKCGTCHGHGSLPVSKSGFDITEYTHQALRNEVTGNYMNLSDTYHEESVPVEALTYQDEKIEAIKKKAFSSIFYNKEVEKLSNQAESWRTILARKKSENQALIPFANQIIMLSQRLIKVSSRIYGKENDGQIVFFPQLVDLTISEISQIIEDLKASKADKKIVEFYETKLIKEVYGEDSKEALIREIKSEILPFTNLDLQEISVITANNLARKIDLFIYFNFDKIVNAIDQERFTSDKETKEKIKTSILAKAGEMFKQASEEAVTAPSFELS